MSNRVEDLERQVAELQAAVNGLTEELVEMKERVRQLEDDREASAEATARAAAETESDESSDAGGERRTHSDDHVEVVEQTGPAAADGAAAGNGSDDVVVPEHEATTPDAEAAKSTGEGDESDEEGSGDSDIIVA